MPRKPGIYRKFKRLQVTALCVNLRDGTTFIDTYITPHFDDRVSVLKYLQKTYDNNRIKVVKVKKMVVKEYKYFLSIESYLKYAKEMEE